MSEAGTGAPPPGWYPDPHGGPGQRWWDGQTWGEQSQPAGPGWGGPPQGATTNGKAIASLVLSIVWVCGLGSIAAVVLGVMARGEIRRSAGRQQGDGLALAGIILGVLGVIGLALTGLLVVPILLSPTLNTYDDFVPSIPVEAEVESALRNAAIAMEMTYVETGSYRYDLEEVGAEEPWGMTLNAMPAAVEGQDYCLEGEWTGSDEWFRLSSVDMVLTAGRC